MSHSKTLTGPLQRFWHETISIIECKLQVESISTEMQWSIGVTYNLKLNKTKEKQKRENEKLVVGKDREELQKKERERNENK